MTYNGSLEVGTVPLERLVAFKLVNDAPDHEKVVAATVPENVDV